MKKVICYLSDDGATVYADAGGQWMLGCVDATGNHPVEVLEDPIESPQATQQPLIMQLVSTGMSAQDIIQLKHGGVI